MNKVKAIRLTLGVSQQALGDGVGCTQGNIGHYERGQKLPPDMAKRVIDFAASRGLDLTFDHIYSDKPLPALALPSTAIKGAARPGQKPRAQKAES